MTLSKHHAVASFKEIPWRSIRLVQTMIETSVASVPTLFWIPQNRATDEVIVGFHYMGGSKEIWLDDEHSPLLTYAIESNTAILFFDCFAHGEWNVDGATEENLISEYWDEMMDKTGIGFREALITLSREREISLKNLIFVGESHGCDTSLELISFRGIVPKIYVAAAFSPYRKFDIKHSAHNNLNSYCGLDLLILAGKNDEYNEDGEVQWLFDQINSNKKELVLFDSTHDLPEDIWVQKVVEFIKTKREI